MPDERLTQPGLTGVANDTLLDERDVERRAAHVADDDGLPVRSSGRTHEGSHRRSRVEKQNGPVEHVDDVEDGTFGGDHEQVPREPERDEI